ncbi:hypothetical protein ABZY45_13405 [Streptomyces sp. NPDC006516]|uniref:hypothetical protein n=1 Tax=Streptomyces sp. NPDC006516 TaxID=3154309 RepID=UPI0033A4193E
MSGSEPVLRVRDVPKSYRRRRVPEGVNFDLLLRQLAGIGGENGAGMSTGFDWSTCLRFCLTQHLRDRGCSAQVVSHLAYDASRLDRMYRLHDGSVGGPRPSCPCRRIPARHRPTQRPVRRAVQPSRFPYRTGRQHA